jgi:hypothetical protein
MRVRRYRYCEPDGSGVIQVQAKKQPSEKTEPRNWGWIVEELIEGDFRMPCFPEVGWRRLSKMIYLGQD